MLSILFEIIKNMFLFTGSYSNNVFPEPLCQKEEEECIKKMLMGDKNARNKLIEHNLRLVAHIVKKYENKYTDTDDLISIGTIGLIKGIDTYNNDKKTKITTYAAKCAENEILMYFRSNKKNDKNVSINDSIGYDKEGNEITFIDILKTPSPDYIEDMYIKDNIKMLSKYMKALTEREKIIITKRYGLFNYKEQTQNEIAKELKISRSYVSRIEKRALTKMLRNFIKDNKTD